MITFEWNNYKFKLLHCGKGVIKSPKNTAHRHSKNSYKLHYILDGKGILYTEDGTYNFSKGDFFVTGPDIYHQQSADQTLYYTECCIYLEACGSKTDNVLVSAFLEKHFYFSNNESISWLFEQSAKEMKEKKLGYESVIIGLISVLLTELTRLYLPESFGVVNANSKINSDNLYDKRIYIIENAFDLNHRGLTLSSLADSLGLCERQTQRLIKKYYGKSFSEKKRESHR